MHYEIASIDKCQLSLKKWSNYRQSNTDIVAIESLYLSLVQNAWNPGKTTVVGRASFLLSNGHISSYFENLFLKLLTYVYVKVLFHSTWPKYKISKSILS